jgi:hypothetical protein
MANLENEHDAEPNAAVAAPPRTTPLRPLALVLLAVALTGTLGLVVKVLAQDKRSRISQPASVLMLAERDESTRWPQSAISKAASAAAHGNLSTLHDPSGETVRWLQARQGGSESTIQFDAHYSTATGVVGSASFMSSVADGRPDHHLREVFVQYAPPEVWTEVPREVVAGVIAKQVVSTTVVDLSRRSIQATAEVVVETKDPQSVLFDFMTVRNADDLAFLSGGPWEQDVGVALREVVRAGEDCGSHADLERLTLSGLCSYDRAEIPGPVRWDLRYQGTPEDRYNTIKGGVAQLRQWMPVPVGTRPAMDITLITPASARVIGLGPPESSSLRGPWRTERWRLAAGAAAPAVTVVPEGFGLEVLQIAGVKVRLHGDRAGKLRGYLQDVLPALARFGLPMPSELDAVLAGRDFSARHSLTVADDLTFAYAPELERWTIAGLVAEQWFGIDVVDELDGTPSVTSAVAGYLATAAAPAQAQVRLWRSFAGTESTTPARAIMTTSAQHRRQAHPLQLRSIRILAALGERLGTERMLAIVRRIHAATPKAALTWQGLVDAVALTDPGEAEWLRRWLQMERLPKLALHAEQQGALLSLSVASDEPRGEGMSVPLVLYAGQAVVGHVTVRVGNAWTPVPSQVPVPAGADRLVLDPEYRTLRSVDVDEDGEPIATEVALDASLMGERGGPSDKAGTGTRSADGATP